MTTTDAQDTLALVNDSLRKAYELLADARDGMERLEEADTTHLTPAPLLAIQHAAGECVKVATDVQRLEADWINRAIQTRKGNGERRR